MQVHLFHSRAADLVGFIPSFLPASDRPAADQFNQYYAHGGGWSPMQGWEHFYDTLRSPTGETIADALFIKYPGDPTYQPVAMIETDIERVWVYQYAWVAIENKETDAVEIARMD